MKKKTQITLTSVTSTTQDERECLRSLVTKGNHKSQKILNALILLDCDSGEYQTNRSTNEEIARVLNISMKKIDRVKKRFVEEGFDYALEKRKANRVYAKKADGDFEAHVVALSCSDPPEGFPAGRYGYWQIKQSSLTILTVFLMKRFDAF